MQAYVLETGYLGMFALWGGLAVQISIFSVLFAISGTMQTFATVFAAISLCGVIYFVFDVAYVFSIELRLLRYFYNAYNMGDCRPGMHRSLLLGVFFIVASLANAFAIVLPELDASGAGDADLAKVAFQGFAMGWFAYGNLALVQAWSFKSFPLELCGLLPISGGAFSCLSSLLTVMILKS